MKIFGDFLSFHQIFLSPKIKRCMNITYKYGIYQLPHELLNDLRIRILKKTEKSENGLKLIEWESLRPSFPNKKEIFLIPAKNFWKVKRMLFLIKFRISLRHFMTECLWKAFCDSDSPKTFSNLISLTILLTLSPFTML